MEVVQSVLNSVEGFDVAILVFLQEHLLFPPLTAFFSAITHLGDAGAFWILLGILLMIPKRTRRAGAMALVSMAAGALVTNLFLKVQVARIRPYDAYTSVLLLTSPAVDYSFPSGHTCASFCSAFIYLKTLPRPYGLLSMVLASLIAFSRLYLGVHYPTDVLGGLLVAGVVSVILLTLLGTGGGGVSSGAGHSSSHKGHRSRGRRGR